MSQSNDLESFDLIELLSVLAKGAKTGALRIYRGQQIFTLWLLSGRVRRMDGAGFDTGAAVLAQLLEDPSGRFHFEADEVVPFPNLNQSHDAFAYAALKRMPPPPLKFDGPGRLEPPERFAELTLDLYEQEVLRGVAEGKPLSELAAARDPRAAPLLGRLTRLRLIGERRTRVARLVVQVQRQAGGRQGSSAAIDETIFRRWREAVGGHIEYIQVREERSGKVYQMPVSAAADAGTSLQLSPELLIRTGLRAGDAVLVRPVTALMGAEPNSS
ncbi:DUF4388 domain-containing protein [Deinococcus detaillensis]|uniref:DUF4388 domain-containing protein n=1 Tax=Deinococcus detaillensis TaxID=2592048 RepID=A0A553UWE2_9DEIO|nr:DUF4388 domain-containing protein [Deinococcus detaillensis]TSA84509.1 DUF4388 domain-containing protein [Deinococcus detaillensis]